MKKIKSFYTAIILIVFAFLFYASATESKFFQAYKATPENGNLSENSVIFEDDNFKVFYNLWAEGGDIGFHIYNKTDDNITINVDKSFFVINGYAYAYYKNRISTSSSNVVTSASFNRGYYYSYANNYFPVVVSPSLSTSSSSSNSVGYNENPNRIVPPKTKIIISEYSIQNYFYSSCDLLKYPSKKEIKSLTFNKDNSPFVFYNIINYTVNGVEKKMENRFYISEIKNLPENEMVSDIYPVDCGKKSSTAITVFNEVSPDRFYITYIKGKNDNDKH
jgi:hypothetical protein